MCPPSLPHFNTSVEPPVDKNPLECAPVASCGGREWAEMTEGFHQEVTRRLFFNSRKLQWETVGAPGCAQGIAKAHPAHAVEDTRG